MLTIFIPRMHFVAVLAGFCLPMLVVHGGRAAQRNALPIRYVVWIY